MSRLVRASVAGAALAVLAMLGVAPAAQAAVSWPSPPSEIFAQTNAHRVSHDGVARLQCSTSLNAVAQAWTQQMVNSGDFKHNPSVGAQIPGGWQGWAENIAMNGGYADGVTYLVNQWINSPGHHANMANGAYTHVGIGYVKDSYGRSWGTQVFARYSGSPDPSLTTIMGVVQGQGATSMSGATVRAVTSGGDVTGYVGSDGSVCLQVPPGSGTVDLYVNGAKADTLGGASGGKTLRFAYTPFTGEGSTSAGVVSQTPQRLIDLSYVDPYQPRCLSVAGRAGVPASATAVQLNVTAAQARGAGNVVVYPDTSGKSTSSPPNASTVNYEAGRDVANSATVALGADGKICISGAGATAGRIILDVTGYVMPAAGITTFTSSRVLDTRVSGGRIEPGTVRTVQVAGVRSVPSNATAVLVNLTATAVSGVGHLRAWAAGSETPSTSVLNFAPGQDKANAQVVKLSGDGKLSLATYMSSADIIVDVTGYVTSGSDVVPVTPKRIVETRSWAGLVGPIKGSLQAGKVYGVTIGSEVPANATAVVLNVTGVQPSGIGHLRVYPGSGSTTPPSTSTLNYIAGRDIPNQAIVGLTSSRVVQFYSSTSGTDLVVDVVGYVVP